MPCNTLLSHNANFDPVEFYKFASELFLQHSSETAYRTIIGRSYYTAHLCAKDSANITNSSGSVHGDVIKYFQTRNRQVYNQMNDLKDLRSKADYKLIETIQKREAGESLRLAKKILSTLNYLPST